jgi:hypothetical protein
MEAHNDKMKRRGNGTLGGEFARGRTTCYGHVDDPLHDLDDQVRRLVPGTVDDLDSRRWIVVEVLRDLS